MIIFSFNEFINQMVSLSPRRGTNEAITANFITRFLSDNAIPHRIQKFDASIPKIDDTEIVLKNGERVMAKTSSLIGGRIDRLNIVDTAKSSYDSTLPNINFNSRADDYSFVDFFSVPSVCVKRGDVKKIIDNGEVDLDVRVDKEEYVSQNILVGNVTDPRAIIFTHYDSIVSGAVDNASGVAIVMAKIVGDRQFLSDNLFVFVGSEELSFDAPIYWGYGYRMFEKDNDKLLESTKKIIIVDGVGHCEPIIISDPESVELVFPICNLQKYLAKTCQIGGSLEDLMPIWHSSDDMLGLIKDKFLDQAYNLLGDLVDNRQNIRN